MIFEDFLRTIKSADPIDLASEYLHKNLVHAIPDTEKYKYFIDNIRNDYPHSKHIAIMGSGNWKFSLNPQKKFREYHAGSDIDIAIICRKSFEDAWDDLRKHHRQNYYKLKENEKNQLRRNGENVYSGFISPKWIPRKSDTHFKYKMNCNKYSVEIIGYRHVNMMYFKNIDEALDYYIRGFRIARQG